MRAVLAKVWRLGVWSGLWMRKCVCEVVWWRRERRWERRRLGRLSWMKVRRTVKTQVMIEAMWKTHLLI